MQRPSIPIPDTPGSYQFKDEQGGVIYVGKAVNLRSRVGSYFAEPHSLHPRTAKMMSVAASVEWIEVRNEVEALILPLLYNLMKNPDKAYIKWEGREAVIKKQIEKITAITRG